MLKKFNPAIIYFLLWCCYKLQGVLYPVGDGISQGILLILLMWSLFCFFEINRFLKSVPQFIKGLNILVLLFTCYGVVLLIQNPDMYITEMDYIKVANFEYLKQIYTSLLPIYSFYYFTRKGLLEDKTLKMMTIVLFAVTIANYMYYSAMYTMLSRGEGVTLNVGYSFLELLPLILLLRLKPTHKYIFFVLCIVFIVLCVKRGAIVIGAICYLWFILSNIQSRRSKATAIFLSLLSLFVVYVYITYTISNNEYFLYRFEQTIEGDSSNRDLIFNHFWNHFINESNLIRLLFGNGANSTLTIGVNYAHNDWLEIAVNNGVFGLIIYIVYFILMIKDAIRIRKRDLLESNTMIMAFIILLMTSFFSMSYASVGLPLCIVLGYISAKQDYKKAVTFNI